MAIAEPFVEFKLYPTKNIGSTATIIFEVPKTCILDSIWLVNIVDTPIKIFSYILREVEKFPCANGILINPLDNIDMLERTTFTMEAGDLLYAYSDFANNRFNSFISYRKLNELGGT